MLRDSRPRSLSSARVAGRRALLAALGAALVLCAGCADSRSLITVAVSTEGGAPLAGVDHLTVTATNEAMRMAVVPVPVPVGNAIPPEVVFSLRLQEGVSGKVRVAASADGADGIARATGETEVTISPAATVTASIALRPVDGRPAGPTRWTPQSSGLFGAAVSALVLDPKHPATVYAATADTGVWVTTDSAATWKVASAGLPRAPILALAMDPVTTTTLYAATQGAGIYKTVNSGGAWTAVNGGPAGMDTGTFYALGVDPGHPAYVFAGLRGPKVYRSANGGAAWTEVSAGIGPYGPEAKSFAFHPSNGTVFLATYGSGLYRMAYDGTMWTAIGGTPLTGNGKYLNAVAYDPGSSQIIYVGGELSGDKLLRSTDGGASWNGVSGTGAVGSLAAYAPMGGGPTRWYVGGALGGTGLSTAPDGVTFTPSMGIAERVSAVAVDPTTAGVAYAGTATGVYKSTNGGLGWTLAVTGLTGNPVTALAIDPKTRSNLYVGLRNAGLLRSTDSAASWSPPAPAGNVPPEQGVTSIAVDEADPKLVWAGTSRTAWRSTSGGGSWMDSALNQPVTALGASGVAGTVYAGSTGNAYVITAQAAWMPAGSGLGGKDVAALAVHPTDAMTVYAAMPGAGLYRTTSGGAAWTPLSAGLPGPAVAAVALDARTPARVLVGTDRGVYVSTGGDFAVSGTGLPAQEVTALAVGRTDPGVVLAGTRSGGVYRSTDGGATWRAFSTGLTTAAITRLVIDPQDAGVAYAGTFDGGVFRSAP